MDKIQWKKEWRLSPREEKNYYGSVLHKDMVVELTDDNGKITRFLEKPSWGEVFSNLANTGI